MQKNQWVNTNKWNKWDLIFFSFAEKKRSHETHSIIKQVTGIKLDMVYLPLIFGQNISENSDYLDQTPPPTDSDQGLYCL